MDYFILCFGRTDFTKKTVEAIQRKAKSTPRIYIINNGWNKEIVPPKILEPWLEFKADAMKSSLVHAFIEIPSINKHIALDSLSIANQVSKEKYFWISDNDCIIKTPDFDQTCLQLMEKHPELHKIGIDFLRAVSLKHCLSYSELENEISYYLTGTDYRIVAEGCEREYWQETGEQPQYYDSAHEISHNLTDTTLSIVRETHHITQKDNRISLSAKNTELLHIGYLEPIYFSPNENLVLEMIHYMNIRPEILTEWRDAYTERKNQYLNNLTLNNKQQIISEYDQMLSSWLGN